MKKLSFPEKRRKARLAAMQALYQWELTQNDINIIAKQFDEDEYFKEIIEGVISDHVVMDEYIKRYIDRPFNDLDPVELSIARLATYELLNKLDVPYRVILNEALELAKNFGAQDGHKFINGVLDKIAREIRYKEITK